MHKALKNLARIQLMIAYLEKENTGTSTELAKKLNISRRTLFRDLETLKELGAAIAFCKTSNSYYLKEKFEFMDCLKN